MQGVGIKRQLTFQAWSKPVCKHRHYTICGMSKVLGITQILIGEKSQQIIMPVCTKKIDPTASKILVCVVYNYPIQGGEIYPF